MGYTPADAAVYIAGVDRSPTEVAALFLADTPDGDPVGFLVDACGLHVAEAADAVDLLDPPWTPPADADGAPSRDALAARAAELGVKVRANASIDTLQRAIAEGEAAEREQVIARAREVFAADELEALDVMTTADIAAAIAAAEAKD